MKRLLAYPFLILGGLVLAMAVLSQLWQAPFRDDAIGLARLFGQTCEVVLAPAIIPMVMFAAMGVPDHLVFVPGFAAYVGGFVLLDVFVSRRVRRSSGDAA